MSPTSDRVGQAWRVTFMHRLRGASFTFVVVSSDVRQPAGDSVAVHSVLVTSDYDHGISPYTIGVVSEWHERPAAPWESICHFARIA